MKRLILSFIIILVSFSLVSSELPHEDELLWEERLGGIDVWRFNSIQNTSDGGYIITADFDPQREHAYGMVIKADLNFNIEWNKTIDGRSSDYFFELWRGPHDTYAKWAEETKDGDYIVLSHGLSIKRINQDVRVIKLSSDGEWLWDEIYDGNYSIEGIDCSFEAADYSEIIKETGDQGFVFLIYSNDCRPSAILPSIFKIDNRGNVEWITRFPNGYLNGHSFNMEVIENDVINMSGPSGRYLIDSDGKIFGCFEDSDCESEEPGVTFCSEDNLLQNLESFTCISPGTVQSSCEKSSSVKLLETCSDKCSGGRCINITCSSDDECDDNDIYTKDICINSGQTNSYCDYENITCLSNSDCEDNNPQTGGICNNPGEKQSFCEFVRIESFPSVIINSPKEGVYGDRRVPIEIEVNESVDEIKYVDGMSSKSKEVKLCNNCNGYGNEKRKTKLFKDGSHNLTFFFIDGEVIVYEESLNFLVDSKNPIISMVKPKGGLSSGTFELKFIEKNPKELFLHYGNDLEGFRHHKLNIDTECFSNVKNYLCKTKIDLYDFNNEEIKYWFELKDIAGNIDKSGKRRLKVDV